MQDYKSMTSELIEKNLTYVLTGFTALIIIIVVLSFYVGVDISPFLSSFKINTIKQVQVNNAVNFISPPAALEKKETSLQIVGEVAENGQISAIQTEKVTYVQNKYIVKLGDTLRTISAQVYGDPEAYAPIMKANNLVSPDVIEVGMELVIPR
ncbi:MAG: LysM peptidoglycan-binding domain-containing protein [bacterium]|nr:LysM peptidoglycan-binding domain-containing protein [bacterium]